MYLYGRRYSTCRGELYLLHVCTCGLHVGRCPPQPDSPLGLTPTLSRSLLLAQAIFKPNHFPYKYPITLYPAILHAYLPMKMEQTECSEMLAYAKELPRRKHTTT